MASSELASSDIPRMKSCVVGKLLSAVDDKVLRSVSFILTQPLDLLRPIHLTSIEPPRLIREDECSDVDMLDLADETVLQSLSIDEIGAPLSLLEV